MKYVETDIKGSFIACGTGFDYKYDRNSKTVEIVDTPNEKPLLHLDLAEYGTADARSFVSDIDKAAQIYAMMLSNNRTLSLCDLFEEQRLISILQNSADIARYSHDLQHLEFSRFSDGFCNSFQLKCLEIKRIESASARAPLYMAKIKTRQNNSTSAMSKTLHGIMRDLSEKTLSDLITAEYWSVNQSSAHNLLTVSSNLATISRVLDHRFSPHRRIARYNHVNAPNLLKESNKTV